MQDSQRIPPQQSPVPMPAAEEAYIPPQKTAPAQTLGSFFRQLIPRDFSAEDLLIVVLLMLMASDGDDGSSALLTLAFYLFL